MRSSSGERPDRVFPERARWAEAVAELRAGALRSGEDPAGLGRRAFLQLLGAGAALAGSACFEAPREKILPYARRPAGLIPGLPLQYATTMELGGYGIGLLAQSREGRPIKIEGNPEHPASLGGTGVFEQASLLDLYDPSRAQSVLARGQPADWPSFARAFGSASSPGGSSPPLHLLIEPSASPLLHGLLDELALRRPGTRIHFYASLQTRSAAEAARAIFGRDLQPLYAFERAAVVLCADADCFGSMPFAARHARDFSERRRVRAPGAAMNRLYAVESAPTLTGNLADQRLARPAWSHAALLAALLRELTAATGAPDALRSALGSEQCDAVPAPWVSAVARDLRAHAGECLVLVGDEQPACVHALAHALNALLGNLGRTLQLIPRALRDDTDPAASLPALADAMRAGDVENLIVLGANPCYSAPADLDFAAAFRRVPHTAYLGLHVDETGEQAEWFVPARHFLESWGDARALDGTASLVQPLIAPLYPGASREEIVAGLAGLGEAPLRDLLRQRWETLAPATAAAPFSWDAALERGVIPGSAAAAVEATPNWDGLAALAAGARCAVRPGPGAIELRFRPDASLHDGRFANNPWLQELPDPITKLSWDNAAWIAPQTAERLGVQSGEWLAIERGPRRLEIPALLVPGCAADSITLSLGYGRRAGVEWAPRAGFDVHPLRTRDALYCALDASARSLAALGESRPPYPLARTQTHFQLRDREPAIAPVRSLSAAALQTGEPVHELPTLYPVEYRAPLQWAMAIDLSICNGCSACVIACQAENNVPVVGKADVLRGREMHWLRIDRYLIDAPDEPPQVLSQPMLCQHCETAPCEYVCPVYATTHSQDGLNQMVYNRCIGTRFCSNNCPYKVRRFNWFDYQGQVPETRQMQFNPEVTVRGRGVIEKCSFCVQRIRRTQIEASNAGRPLRDGDVQTACQQACPARAIRFGSQSEPDSEVSRELRAPQVYSALEELGTRPRTRYLAALRNPNPELAGAAASRDRAED